MRSIIMRAGFCAWWRCDGDFSCGRDCHRSYGAMPQERWQARRLRARRAMKRIALLVLEAALTLWLLATLCFFLLHAAPGGPFDSEKAAPPEVQAALDAQYRLDQPLLQQYARWLGDV